MYNINQSTALDFPFFAHDENGDPVTGLADGDFTKKISKAGGTFASMTVTITEREAGWYLLPLSTSHTDTQGILTVYLTATGIKQVNLQFNVGGALTDVNVAQISGDSTAADNLEAMLDGTRAKLYLSQLDIQAEGNDNAINAYGSGTGKGAEITGKHGVNIAGSGLNGIGLGISGGDDGEGSFGLYITSTAGSAVKILSENLHGIDFETALNDISGNLSGSIGSLAAQAKADVNAEMDAALADVNLDHLVGTADGIPSVPAGTFLDQIMDDGTATYDRTTDSLQAIADNAGGGSLTAQQVRDAMKLAPSAGEPAEGSVDTHLDTIESDAAAAADNVGTAISLDGGTATLAGMLTKMADDNGGADFDAATDSLEALGEGGGGLTAQEVRDAMKLAPSAGAPAAGSVDTHLDTVEANIGSPAALDGGAATLAGMLTKMADDNGGADFDAARHSLAEILESFVEAIKAKTDLLTFTGGNLDAIANVLGATAKSEVNAEVVDVIGTDTLAEMGAGAPTATPTIKQALMYLYMALRNASYSTATERGIKNNAGTTIAKATMSDDGTTFDQGKLGAP